MIVKHHSTALECKHIVSPSCVYYVGKVMGPTDVLCTTADLAATLACFLANLWTLAFALDVHTLAVELMPLQQMEYKLHVFRS